MVPLQQSSMQLPHVLFIVYCLLKNTIGCWKTQINFIHWSWMVPTLRGWNAPSLLELCSDSAAKSAQKWLHTSPNLLHLSTEAPSKGPDIPPHLGSCQHTSVARTNESSIGASLLSLLLLPPTLQTKSILYHHWPPFPSLPQPLFPHALWEEI